MACSRREMSREFIHSSFHCRRTEQIKVGSLGVMDFASGFYSYTGSARGSGGLKRVDRHILVSEGIKTTRRWHIDYLLPHTSFQEVFISKTMPGSGVLHRKSYRKAAHARAGIRLHGLPLHKPSALFPEPGRDARSGRIGTRRGHDLKALFTGRVRSKLRYFQQSFPILSARSPYMFRPL